MSHPFQATRMLDDQDVIAFVHAAAHPVKRKVKPTDMAGVFAELRFKYPLRIRRLRKDINWLMKQLNKYGVELQ